ncbi:MAG: Tim44 domain-containing protein [Candidatus Fonsibacter sp.]|nr:Tim44 domain-containing protein [Candidatus Fonsibacter sp.]
MNDNFGYIDIVLLAIVAGIIILRLRNVLGKGAEDSVIRAKKSVVVDAQFEDVNPSRAEANINLREFKEDTFLKGAQAAYEMIVNAFASADKKTLKDLTSPEVYKSFVSVLDERNNKKYVNQFTFIGIKKTKIENVDKKDNSYTVKTRFVSEIISCVKDVNNNVIEGSPEEIQTVNDVWSFSRDLNSDDPTWYLTEIAQDVHGKV